MNKVKHGVTGDGEMPPLPMTEEEYKAMAYERYNCIDERSGSIDEIKAPIKDGDYVRYCGHIGIGVVRSITLNSANVLFENHPLPTKVSVSLLERVSPEDLRTVGLKADGWGIEGGTKHDNGKPDLSLLPSVFVKEVARALMYGENKYGRYNFEKGFDTHRLVGACLRHICAWNDGEDNDPESGVSHLAHAAASIAMLLRCLELGTATDTRSRANRQTR